MYCPVCFGDTLIFHPKGTIIVEINGAKRDNGMFLYNKDKQTQAEMLEELEKKIKEFFVWYSGFQNRTAIEKVHLLSGDVECTSGCKLDKGSKFNSIGHIFSVEEIREIIERLGEKYQIEVNYQGDT